MPDASNCCASITATLSQSGSVSACRICGSAEVHAAGDVEYYAGFRCTIIDCDSCGCRFTEHQQDVYDWLYSHPASPYGIYREIGETVEMLFHNGDAAALRSELYNTPKYRFVLESIERSGCNGRILELGCSRGHLTSYFILNRFDITGSDTSHKAISDARTAFGDYFVHADSPLIAEKAPYETIYHVGTIGCVANPLGLTRSLLRLLKRGGQLLFNAPNADSCSLPGQLWIDEAPPPDVVTLFRPGFWRNHFSDIAEVEERVERCSANQSMRILLRKMAGQRWQTPSPQQLDTSIADYRSGRSGRHTAMARFWSVGERVAVKAAAIAQISRALPRQPSPFGLFVRITKK
jgi:SAM-dependent methyltransferase